MFRTILTVSLLLGYFASLADAAPQLDVREEATVAGVPAILFGFSGTQLALESDTVVFGAPQAGGAAAGEGEVRVLRRNGAGAWLLEQTLKATTPQMGARFGSSVALSGETLAVATPFESHSGVTSAGAIYVFVRSGSVWTLEQRIQLPTPLSGDIFGEQLDLDGDVLVVGTPNEASILAIPEGTTRVYRRSSGVWTEEALLPSPTGAKGDQFGFRVSVSGDTLIASSFEGYSNAGGAVFVYTFVAGAWTFQQELRASDALPNSYFGYSVDLEGDRAAISNRRGAVYVFERTASVWAEDVRLLPPSAVGAGLSQFTDSVVALDGDILAQGFGSDSTAGAMSGSSMLWRNDGALWDLEATFFRGEGQAGEGFGAEIDIDNGYCAVMSSGSAESSIFTFAPEVFPTTCYGDATAAASGCTPCPCGNAAFDGTFGGCLNSRGRFARLVASGSPSSSNDTLTLELSGAATNTFALLFAGDSLLPAAGACPPGSGVQSITAIDGLRCVGFGPAILRLGVRPTNAAGESANPWGGGGLIASAGLAAGETLHLQVFYRDISSAVCGTGQNSTNAVSVAILP